ncbi:MAG: DUF502 domain-containing protein [Gemmatimonadaceae bacterium]
MITLVGFLASNLLAMGFVSLLERLMTRLPFIRILYTSTKDLLDAFVGEKRRFDTPVIDGRRADHRFGSTDESTVMSSAVRSFPSSPADRSSYLLASRSYSMRRPHPSRK